MFTNFADWYKEPSCQMPCVKGNQYSAVVLHLNLLCIFEEENRHWSNTYLYVCQTGMKCIPCEFLFHLKTEIYLSTLQIDSRKHHAICHVPKGTNNCFKELNKHERKKLFDQVLKLEVTCFCPNLISYISPVLSFIHLGNTPLFQHFFPIFFRLSGIPNVHQIIPLLSYFFPCILVSVAN